MRWRGFRVDDREARLTVVGQFAGTSVRHPFAPDGNTGTTCMGCYGWCDDPRHLHAPTLPVGAR